MNEIRKSCLVPGTLPPQATVIKQLIKSLGYIPESCDIHKDIKFVGGTSYSMNNKTFMIYEDEFDRFKYLLCVKTDYTSGYLLDDKVYLLDTDDIRGKLSKYEIYHGVKGEVKYKINEEDLKDITPLISHRAVLEEKQLSLPYDFVTSPDHYNDNNIETIEKIYRVFGKTEAVIFCKINEFKYRDRIGLKPGEDEQRELSKIKWYREKRLEFLKREE